MKAKDWLSYNKYVNSSEFCLIEFRNMSVYYANEWTVIMPMKKHSALINVLGNVV